MALGTVTNRVDHPGHLIADDAWWLGGIGIRPLRRHHLREVQASRADTNADLARAGLRIGRFPHLQGLGPGRPSDPDRFAQLAEEVRPVVVVEHSEPGQRAELGRAGRFPPQDRHGQQRRHRRYGQLR